MPASTACPTIPLHPPLRSGRCTAGTSDHIPPKPSLLLPDSTDSPSIPNIPLQIASSGSPVASPSASSVTSRGDLNKPDRSCATNPDSLRAPNNESFFVDDITSFCFNLFHGYTPFELDSNQLADWSDSRKRIAILHSTPAASSLFYNIASSDQGWRNPSECPGDLHRNRVATSFGIRWRNQRNRHIQSHRNSHDETRLLLVIDCCQCHFKTVPVLSK